MRGELLNSHINHDHELRTEGLSNNDIFAICFFMSWWGFILFDWFFFIKPSLIKSFLYSPILYRGTYRGPFSGWGGMHVNWWINYLRNQLEKLEAAKAAWKVCLCLLSLTGTIFTDLPGPFSALLGLTQPYWALLSLTGPYSALLRLTQPYLSLLSLT